MTDRNEAVTLDWDVEHARFEREMFGLVRALCWRLYKKARRPRACWNDMCDDACIFAWRAWSSLRRRNLEPQQVGVWAIAHRAVLSTLQGARFQPLGSRGDRSWADSIHNKRNGLKVKSNQEDWQLTGSVEGDQEEHDLVADWSAWKATLASQDKGLVEALESGGLEAVKSVKGISRRKRALADGFRAYRQG